MQQHEDFNPEFSNELKKTVKKAHKKLDKIFKDGGKYDKLLTDATRKGLLNKALEKAESILNELTEERVSGSSTNDLQRTYKTLIETSNILAEEFNEKEKEELQGMSDKELNKILKEGKVTITN